MQLSFARSLTAYAGAPSCSAPLGTSWCRLLAAGVLIGLAPTSAHAQSHVSAGTSAFRESGGPLDMLVIVPEVSAEVAISEGVAVDAAWTADVVSGASVAIVDQPAAEVDAISAASVSDVRHELGGGLALRDGQSVLNAGYRHGTEEDYRSHAFHVGARTELWDRNTGLEITYARAFDSVCDSIAASEPVLKQRLDSSEGCFDEGAEDRDTRKLSLHTAQGVWTQSWTPWLAMQTTLSAQLLHGFQSNPYRAVRLGRSAAQEHHPDERGRYAVGVGFRIWLEPLSGALQPQLRVYRDTWSLRSFTAELGYEQVIGVGLRLRGRGRYYLQSGTAFFSDDYLLEPKGQYFTGDRELSPMRSVLLGAQLSWTAPTNDEGKVLIFDGLTLALKGDVLKSWFPEFHYDRVAVPNDTALMGSFSVRADF
jgi:hypothetical protein